MMALGVMSGGFFIFVSQEHPMKLPISEIFYSIQGEGGRAGHPSIFIRIQGCKAKGACYALGIKCDTEFESGEDLLISEILERIKGYPCRWIVFTGGEPADRITNEVLDLFHEAGYLCAIETSGLFPVASDFDYISVSPKVAEHVLEKNFQGKIVDELRYVRHSGQPIPKPGIQAHAYYLSPHFDGWNPNQENINHCIKLAMDNPPWRLSIQTHKLLNVL